MAFREYTLAPGVAQMARKAGIYGRVEFYVKKMARESAPYTHKQGNRRFGEYLLKVQGEVVVGVWRLGKNTVREVPEISGPIHPHARNCTLCHGKMKLLFWETHESCKGKGCPVCEFRGEVAVIRPCQAVYGKEKAPCQA